MEDYRKASDYKPAGYNQVLSLPGNLDGVLMYLLAKNNFIEWLGIIHILVRAC